MIENHRSLKLCQMRQGTMSHHHITTTASITMMAAGAAHPPPPPPPLLPVTTHHTNPFPALDAGSVYFHLI
jgi:hypothetical protein